MVPVCDKRYHIYNRFRHFWAEIKKLWNYPLLLILSIGITEKLFIECPLELQCSATVVNV